MKNDATKIFSEFYLENYQKSIEFDSDMAKMANSFFLWVIGIEITFFTYISTGLKMANFDPKGAFIISISILTSIILLIVGRSVSIYNFRNISKLYSHTFIKLKMKQYPYVPRNFGPDVSIGEYLYFINLDFGIDMEKIFSFTGKKSDDFTLETVSKLYDYFIKLNNTNVQYAIDEINNLLLKEIGYTEMKLLHPSKISRIQRVADAFSFSGLIFFVIALVVMFLSV